MKTKKEIMKDILDRERKRVEWERTHILPDISNIYNLAEVGT